MKNTAVILVAMLVIAGAAFWAGLQFRGRATRPAADETVAPAVAPDVTATPRETRDPTPATNRPSRPETPPATTTPEAPPAARETGTRAAAIEPAEKSFILPDRPAADPLQTLPPWVLRELAFPRPAYDGTPIVGLIGYYDPRVIPGIRFPTNDQVVSLRKPVTTSAGIPILGELRLVTDGDVRATEGSFVQLKGGPQSVTVDLQATYAIDGIVVWHHHLQPRVYRDVVVQVSESPAFTNAVTVFNNDRDNTLGLGAGIDEEYLETYLGLPIELNGVRGSYVRLYSNGSTADAFNHYVEVTVFGHPPGR